MFETTEPLVPPAPICNVPADTVVKPANVLVPAKINVPAPSLVKPPEPPSIEAKVMLLELPESTTAVTPDAKEAKR